MGWSSAAALSHHRGIAFMGLGRVCAGSVLTHCRGPSLLRNAAFCLWLTCDKLRACSREVKIKTSSVGEMTLLKGVEGIEGSSEERKEVRSEHKPRTWK